MTLADAWPRAGASGRFATTTPAAFAIGAVGTLLAVSAFLTILAAGHLDEDAYILFTYSTNLAAEHGPGPCAYSSGLPCRLLPHSG